MHTFGRVRGLVLAEPGQVFVLQPGHVRVVVLVVLLARPGLLFVRHLLGGLWSLLSADDDDILGRLLGGGNEYWGRFEGSITLDAIREQGP